MRAFCFDENHLTPPTQPLSARSTASLHQELHALPLILQQGEGEQENAPFAALDGASLLDRLEHHEDEITREITGRMLRAEQCAIARLNPLINREPVPALPQEICGEVTRYVRPTSYESAALCLVSRQWHQSVQESRHQAIALVENLAQQLPLVAEALALTNREEPTSSLMQLQRLLHHFKQLGADPASQTEAIDTLLFLFAQQGEHPMRAELIESLLGTLLERLDDLLPNNHLMERPAFVIAALQRYPLLIEEIVEFTGPHIRAHQGVALEAVRLQGTALHFFSPPLRDDPRVVQVAVSQNSNAFPFAGPQCRDSQQILWRAIESAHEDHLCSPLRFASTRLKSSREDVLFAIRHCPLALVDACPQLQLEEELLCDAARRNPEVITALFQPRWERAQLEGPEAMQCFVQQHEELAGRLFERGFVEAFRFLSPPKRHDPKNALLAVHLDGRMLGYVGTELRDDPEIVQEAILRSPLALEFASPRLRDHDQIVETAIRGRGVALQFTSQRLRGYLPLAQLAVEQEGTAYRHVLDPARQDRDLAFLSLQGASFDARHFPEPLLDDRQFVLAMVSKQGGALRFVSERLRRDPDVVRAARQNFPPARRWALLQISMPHPPGRRAH